MNHVCYDVVKGFSMEKVHSHVNYIYANRIKVKIFPTRYRDLNLEWLLSFKMVYVLLLIIGQFVLCTVKHCHLKSFLFSITQEFDIRGAVPFSFYNAALNAGISAGVVLPLGRGFWGSPSSVPDRFFLGGNSSPVCSLGGLNSLLGFKTRGIGPTELRRFVPSESAMDDSAASPGRDYLGGDFAVSAFADLSFDLPLKLFRDAGIHGHAFLTAGNLAKLSEGEYRNFSFAEFRHTFRSSAGVGIIIPTKLFRVEVRMF